VFDPPTSMQGAYSLLPRWAHSLFLRVTAFGESWETFERLFGVLHPIGALPGLSMADCVFPSGIHSWERPQRSVSLTTISGHEVTGNGTGLAGEEHMSCGVLRLQAGGGWGRAWVGASRAMDPWGHTRAGPADLDPLPGLALLAPGVSQQSSLYTGLPACAASSVPCWHTWLTGPGTSCLPLERDWC
jgi:hypothetical protein